MKFAQRQLSFNVATVLLSAIWCMVNAQQRPLAYWSFDSVRNNTFIDNSGNGYNATWTGSGVGLAAGINGNAVECPITGGYDISVANSANSFVINHFSIEAWVSMDTIITNGQQHLLNFQNTTTSTRNGYALNLASGSPTISYSSFDGTVWINCIAGPILQTNTWYHIVGTFDSLFLRIYLNGVLQTTTAAQGGIRPPGANANIGCKKLTTGDLSYYFGGKIDELRLYNYTLSADSILAYSKRYLVPPGLIAPASGSVNQPVSPTLAWGTVNGATSFNLQVSTTSAFSSTIFQNSNVSSLSLTINGLLDSTVYFWRVNALSTSGNSNWSSIWMFTTAPRVPDVPILQSPLPGTLNQPLSLYLIWGTANRAVTYGLQVSTSSFFSSTVISQTGLTTTVGLASGLNNNSIYYWHVNASNAGGISAWSLGWKFGTIYIAPGVPILLSPATGTIGQPQSLKLYWSAANLATTYSLQVSTSSAFISTVINQSSISGLSSSINGLANNSMFYWRVNASNSGGTSIWSNTWSFVVGLTSLYPSFERKLLTFALKNGAVFYNLNQACPVEIRIYDMQGKKLYGFQRLQQPGSYSISMKNLNLAPELYLVRFKAGKLQRQVVMMGK